MSGLRCFLQNLPPNPVNDALRRLREWVWGDTLQASRLGAIPEEAELVAEVMQAATARNLPLSIEAVRDALDHPHTTIVTAEDVTMKLTGWLPVRVKNDPPDQVEWCWAGSQRFTEPFFEQSVRRLRAQPFNRLFRLITPFAMLMAHARQASFPAPAGFIFHWSRCGSTLAAQMLAALPRHRVLSEAEPIDTLLRSNHLSNTNKITALQALIAALNSPYPAKDQRLFIKFDSWHLLELPLITEAFPQVPWIFLYRNPIEILVSHRWRRGSQMVPGLLPAERLGLPHEVATQLPFDEYGVHLLAILGQAAVAAKARGKALSYERLCAGGGRLLLETVGMTPTDEEVLQMESGRRTDAKEPMRPFVPDSAMKQAQATEREHRLCRERLEPLMHQLEAWQQESGLYKLP